MISRVRVPRLTDSILSVFDLFFFGFRAFFGFLSSPEMNFRFLPVDLVPVESMIV